jgi:hypothetical protein
MTPIDATYRQALSSSERQLNSAAVWGTFSRAGQGVEASATTGPLMVTQLPAQYHILGIDVNVGAGSEKMIPVFASDMYPRPSRGAAFAVRDWHRSALCMHGADAVATGCVRVGGGGSRVDDPLVTLDRGMSWPFGTHTTQLYTATILQPGTVLIYGGIFVAWKMLLDLTPADLKPTYVGTNCMPLKGILFSQVPRCVMICVTVGQVTLLGELDKFVPLSGKRFSDVISSADGLLATVTGQPGEVVHVTALRPKDESWVVEYTDITIGANGTGQLSF